MTAATHSVLPAAARFVPAADLSCIVGALTQIVLGIVETVDPQGPTDPPVRLVLGGISFVLLLVGVIGLARSRAAGDGWLARIGLGLAIAGSVLFVVAVLADLFASNDSLFNVASLVTALGMLLAGIAVLRAGTWRGWHRATPLLCGLYPLAVLPPVFALTGGPNYLAIAGGNVFWLALGVALLTETRATPPAR